MSSRECRREEGYERNDGGGEFGMLEFRCEVEWSFAASSVAICTYRKCQSTVLCNITDR